VATITVTVIVDDGSSVLSSEFEISNANPLYHASELDKLLEKARANAVPMVARVFGDIRDRSA